MLFSVLALAGSLSACNPFAGLENMEGCGITSSDTSLQPEDTAKLEPTITAMTAMRVGTVSWTETGTQSTVVITSELDQEYSATPTRDVDCDGHFQGYYAYLVAGIRTSDVSFDWQPLHFTVHLDSQAQVNSGEAKLQVPLSLERLKALGVAPNTIPDDSQFFTLTLAPPDMKPRDTQIVVRDGAASVSLGDLNFP